MRLKNQILIAIVLLQMLVIGGNAWHLSRLTNAVSEKFGEAAFDVSRKTVESMLSQRINAAISNYQKVVERLFSGDRQVRVTEKPLSMAQEVELSMQDRSESRVIQLVSGERSFEIPIPRTELEMELIAANRAIIYTSVATLLFTILVMYWFANRLTRPLKQICSISAKIGAGEFQQQLAPLDKTSSVELKELVQSINRMSQRLTALEQEKVRLQERKTTNEISEIVRGMAHSIRNPLHTMLLTLSTLDTEQPKVDRIKQQIHRIDRSIKDLMSITTHESLTAQKLNLSELITDNIEQVHGQSSIQLTNLLDENNSEVLGIASEINACVHTLLTNALEACSAVENANNSPPCIRVKLSQAQTQWQIEVCDNGCGVSEEIREKLFTPHVTNKVHGAGMGLYIAKRIASGRYGGDLEYKPNQGRGSCFVLTLNDRNY
ncbi:MAG: HAMP domain-containing histidine kinase [Gammaproteobacteria bacterium]|nr:HAMP domain-containing histidine kinase [Gammaproteobacteria bacterium]NVK87736.1 HAMP domain-containing histidine kinase [Gammaproteobacteria bacterium]